MYLPDSDCHRLNCGNVCESDLQEDLRLFGVAQCRPLIILRSLEQRVIACLLASFHNGSRSRERNLYRKGFIHRASTPGKTGGMYGKTPEYVCEGMSHIILYHGQHPHETFPKPRDNVETAGKTLRSRGRTSTQPREEFFLELSLGFDKWTGGQNITSQTHDTTAVTCHHVSDFPCGNPA